MNEKRAKRHAFALIRHKFSIEVRTISVKQRRSLFRLGVVLAIIGCISFSLILMQVVTMTGIERADEAVTAWIATYRHVDITDIFQIPAYVFGPIILPVIIVIIMTVWFILSKHAWRPLIFAFFMGIGLLIATLFKHIIKRERPPLDQMLLGKDYSFSFPSGHVFATADFVLLLSFLLISRNPSKRNMIIGILISFIVITFQMISRIYLGYHWLSDTVASVCGALFVLGILILVDTYKTTKLSNEKLDGILETPQTENT